MNDELYKLLTLDRIRGFANKDELHLNEDDLITVIIWLNMLRKEICELQGRFRTIWREKHYESH